MEANWPELLATYFDALEDFDPQGALGTRAPLAVNAVNLYRVCTARTFAN